MRTDSAAALEKPQDSSRLVPGTDWLANLPWWLLIVLLLGLLIVYRILTNEQYNVIFRAIIEGIRITLLVTISAYSLAVVIGLLVGLARVSSNKVIFNLASFYVEVIRGIPILVLLIYIAFVGVAGVISGLNAVGDWLLSLNIGLGRFLAEASSRNVSNEMRVILGLGIAYGAFSAEIFRAGIQSIERGQMEAARALGMSYIQAMRYIILPQAIRRVLPALGNDFIAMLKDSSLVSVLGVRDVTQLAKLYASSTFLFFQTYSILAFIYLTMTIMLTRVVRWIEARLSQDRR